MQLVEERQVSQFLKQGEHSLLVVSLKKRVAAQSEPQTSGEPSILKKVGLQRVHLVLLEQDSQLVRQVSQVAAVVALVAGIKKFSGLHSEQVVVV